MNSRSRTGIFNIKLIIFPYIVATVIHPSTTTKNTAKVVLVAADKTRPLPKTQQKWYWSQQTRPDHYQKHDKVVLVAADKTRPLPISRQKWYWSQQTRPDHYQYHGESGTGRNRQDPTTTNITAKVVLVAADKTRPPPISQQKRYWSQQIFYMRDKESWQTGNKKRRMAM